MGANKTLTSSYARDESFSESRIEITRGSANVRCWNAPSRKEVLKDVNQHVIHDNNTCLFMVMSEMAYRRSRESRGRIHQHIEKD